jgi:branched-chain amino acid transport system permease protein
MGRGTFHETYGQDMAIFQKKSQWGILLAFLILLFVSPFFVSDRLIVIMTMIGISIISVQGLNILTGYCGQISMGHVGFMAVGGYVSAVLTAHFGWPFWAALPAAGLGAGIAGLVFGLPSLRIRGFYLIMATLASHFIIIWLVLHTQSLTGGADGMNVPKPKFGSFVFDGKISYFYLVMIVGCIATYAAVNIARTRAGRAFVAIRDNDLAAEVMGINLWVYKLQAFFIGCMYAGIAGALTVHLYAFASVDQFPFMDSVWYVGMLIVGGMGSIPGAILGAVSLKLLDEVVTLLGPILSSTFSGQAAASLAFISRGLVIILFLIFEPRGLEHRWEAIKTYFRIWPFSRES